MTACLTKNGEVFCGLRAANVPCPADGEESWHDCVLLAEKRVDTHDRGIWAILSGGRTLPFAVRGCRIAVTGWLVEGQVLC